LLEKKSHKTQDNYYLAALEPKVMDKNFIPKSAVLIPFFLMSCSVNSDNNIKQQKN
jgi:hypothetical protein